MIKHHAIAFMVTAILIGAISISLVSADASYTMDFEGLTEGAIVSELSCGSGITCPGGNLGGTVSVKAHNPAIGSGNINTAMIFNADCIAFVDCTGEDDDLSFPGHGKILINSEDLDQTDPDDQINPGSFMEFDFSEFGPGAVTVDSIDVGDIEGAEFGAFLLGADGPCIGTEFGENGIPLPVTGNNVIRTVDFELTGVNCLLVQLNGSGAIDNIHFTTNDPPAPAIDIEKATNGEDADEPPGPVMLVGSTVEFTYEVSNTGNVDLTSVSVLDDQGVTVTCPQDTLAFGESMTCTGGTTATEGQYTNLGTACGEGAGATVCDDDPSNHLGAAPAIDIEKATNGEDADEPTGPVVLVGSTVEFTYEVSNTGNVDLTNVTVRDDLVSVPVTGSASATIDFEGLTEGAIVSELSCGSGITCPVGNIGGTVSVRAHNPSINSGNTNSAMIFNSDCVISVDCTGGDEDLSFPGHGKTLINSADLDQTDPDDQINPGSFMEFDFSDFGPGEVSVHSIDVGDIEVRQPRAFVDSTDGPCIGIEIGLDEMPLPFTGNNVNETVDFELLGVRCLHVHLNGSGSIDNIKFTTVDQPANDVVAVTCPQDTLAVGESMTCTGSTVATPGQYTNLGTACGDWAEQNVCDDDLSNHLGADTATTIEQQTDQKDADDVPQMAVGAEIAWNYAIKTPAV